jgi:hypothetical protein
MKIDKNEQGFLDVGDYVELTSVTELDRYAYSQGLGKVILEGDGDVKEEVLGVLEVEDFKGIESATKDSPLTFLGDGSLTLGDGNPSYDVYKCNGLYVVKRVR